MPRRNPASTSSRRAATASATCGALAAIERALELDPYNIRIQSFYAQVLLGTRRYDDAIAAARRVLSVQPNTGLALTALTAALYKKGLYDELLALEREHWAKDPEILEALEKGHVEAGYPGAVKRCADILAARHGKPGGPRAYIVANSYARVGDIERVIECSRKLTRSTTTTYPT